MQNRFWHHGFARVLVVVFSLMLLMHFEHQDVPFYRLAVRQAVLSCESMCIFSQLCGLVSHFRRRLCMVLGPQPGAFHGFFATEVFALPRSWRLILCSSSGRTTRKQRWEHGGTWSTSKKNQNKNTLMWLSEPQTGLWHLICFCIPPWVWVWVPSCIQYSGFWGHEFC